MSGVEVRESRRIEREGRGVCEAVRVEALGARAMTLRGALVDLICDS